MDITDKFMGQNLYLGELIEKVNNIPGVTNVLETKVFNKVGDGYSLNEISQAFINDTTREIEQIDFTVFGEPNTMFEIKFPEKDIRVFLK